MLSCLLVTDRQESSQSWRRLEQRCSAPHFALWLCSHRSSRNINGLKSQPQDNCTRTATADLKHCSRYADGATRHRAVLTQILVCPDIEVGTGCPQQRQQRGTDDRVSSSSGRKVRCTTYSTETHPVWPNHGHRRSRRPGPPGQGSHRVFGERSGWRFSARQYRAVYGSVGSRK